MLFHVATLDVVLQDFIRDVDFSHDLFRGELDLGGRRAGTIRSGEVTIIGTVITSKRRGSLRSRTHDARAEAHAVDLHRRRVHTLDAALRQQGRRFQDEVDEAVGLLWVQLAAR